MKIEKMVEEMQHGMEQISAGHCKVLVIVIINGIKQNANTLRLECKPKIKAAGGTLFLQASVHEIHAQALDNVEWNGITLLSTLL